MASISGAMRRKGGHESEPETTTSGFERSRSASSDVAAPSSRRHRRTSGAAAADWRFVYVAEAHAQDEWPLRSARFSADGQPVVVDQPKTLDARLGLARRFKADYGIKSQLLVDNPADEAFERLYAPWPLRLYVVRGATLAWIAEPDGATFEPAVARLRAMFNLE